MSSPKVKRVASIKTESVLKDVCYLQRCEKKFPLSFVNKVPSRHDRLCLGCLGLWAAVRKE